MAGWRKIAVFVALAALAWSPAFAGAYRIVLDAPPTSKLLHGYGGLAAADERSATALVRVIAPGNDIHERGTVRVLVMNLGTVPFEFGPDDVKLSLTDGTVLKPVPVGQMEDGRILVEREMQHAATTDMQNRNNLAGLQQQSNSGGTVQSSSPMARAAGPAGGTESQDRRSDDMLLPGAKLLDSIYQILVPLKVEPNKAWGGYYVFEMPKAAFRKKADQPLTIVVRTGAEEHRFDATLKWK